MVIVGLGGCTKDLLNDMLQQQDRDGLLFYTDWKDDPSLPYFRSVKGLLVTSDEAVMRNHIDNIDNRFLVAIGDNHKRERMVHRMEALGGTPHYYFSDRAMLIEDLSAISRRNVIIMRFGNVSANVTVSEGAIIYAYCAIAHDSHIGKYAFMSAYSVGASIIVKDHAFVGLSSVIMSGVTVGRNAIVGASSLVKHDVPDNAVAYGSPATVARIRDEDSF